MRAYRYKAYTEDGRRKSGSVVAETEIQATDQLKTKGLFVTDLDAGDVVQGSKRAFSGFSRSRLNSDLQAVFTRQMAVLLAAGLPAEEALEAVRNSGGNTSMDAIAARARAALLAGAPLSEALAESGAGFPPYYTAAVRAGETSGDADKVFGELAEHLETVGLDRAKISTALIYPAFVAAVSLLVCTILVTNVAPEIVALFELSGRPLPELTQNVLTVSNWIERNSIGLSVVAAVGAVFWIVAAQVPSLRDRRDRLFLRVPLVGKFMKLAAAVQYLRTLALVLSSRQPVPAAAESAGQVLTVSKFRDEGDEVSRALRTGQPLSEALQHLSIIPPVARQLIGAGEASARLARMTERSAVLVENGLSTERKRIAALLEPLLMMVVGGFVLVIVLAVLLPIFDLQSVVAG